MRGFWRITNLSSVESQTENLILKYNICENIQKYKEIFKFTRVIGGTTYFI